RAGARELDRTFFIRQRPVDLCDAVIPKAEQLQLVVELRRVQEAAGTHRRCAQFRRQQPATVAARLALVIATHRVVSADAELLAREQVRVGPLPRAAEHEREIFWQTIRAL